MSEEDKKKKIKTDYKARPQTVNTWARLYWQRFIWIMKMIADVYQY